MNEYIELKAVSSGDASAIPGIRNQVNGNEKPICQMKQRSSAIFGSKEILRLYPSGIVEIHAPSTNTSKTFSCSILQCNFSRRPLLQDAFNLLTIALLPCILVLVSNRLLLPDWVTLGALVLLVYPIVQAYQVSYSLYSVGGNARLLSIRKPLIGGKPARRFLRALQCSVEERNSNEQLPLPSLVAEHRRLAEHGLISATDYDIAKSRLFKSA